MVVEEDDEAEGAGGEGLGGDEGVVEGGLGHGGDGAGVAGGRVVLDVEGEVHGVAEGGVQGVHYEVLVPLVVQAHQELHQLTRRHLCTQALTLQPQHSW